MVYLTYAGLHLLTHPRGFCVAGSPLPWPRPSLLCGWVSAALAPAFPGGGCSDGGLTLLPGHPSGLHSCTATRCQATGSFMTFPAFLRDIFQGKEAFTESSISALIQPPSLLLSAVSTYTEMVSVSLGCRANYHRQGDLYNRNPSLVRDWTSRIRVPSPLGHAEGFLPSAQTDTCKIFRWFVNHRDTSGVSSTLMGPRPHPCASMSPC